MNRQLAWTDDAWKDYVYYDYFVSVSLFVMNVSPDEGHREVVHNKAVITGSAAPPEHHIALLTSDRIPDQGS